MNYPDNKTWDLIAHDYTGDYSFFEQELAAELIEIFDSIGVNKSKEIAELGCGSGHLSGLLAEAGFPVALIDFSEVSLEKARNFFSKHHLKGRFLKRDLLQLDGSESYYLTWNCGVMEHFDRFSLISAFAAINRATKQYFVFLVPNSESLPYLLYRYKKKINGQWNVGKEYLRKNYRDYLELCGFRVNRELYCGWGITKNFYEYFDQNKDNVNIFSSLIDAGFVPQNNAYLVCYVCEKIRNVEINEIEIPDHDITEELTLSFDTLKKDGGLSKKSNLLRDFIENILNGLRK